MTNTKNIETLNFILEKGICITDNICVFCSKTMEGQDRTCRKCNDYKGVMNIRKAIETYGQDIIGW
jgi:hypothetical protein